MVVSAHSAPLWKARISSAKLGENLSTYTNLVKQNNQKTSGLSLLPQLKGAHIEITSAGIEAFSILKYLVASFSLLFPPFAEEVTAAL